GCQQIRAVSRPMGAASGADGTVRMREGAAAGRCGPSGRASQRPEATRGIGAGSTQSAVAETGLFGNPDLTAFDPTPPAIAGGDLSFAYPGDPARPALDGVSF